MKRKNLIFILVLCLLCLVLVFVGCDRPSGSLPDNSQQDNSTNPDLNPAPTPSPDPTTPDTTPVDPTPQPQPPVESGERILVVYFSYSGTTQRVANEMARQLGVEAVEIVPTIAYTPADVNYNNRDSRNRQELANDLRPEISDTTYNAIDIDNYNTVVIGYPIWNGYEPMIIRTFIEHYNSLQGKTVYTFSTSSSSLGSTAHNGIKSRYANADVKENLHLTSSAISSMQTRIENWLKQNNLIEENIMESNTLYLKIGSTTLTATLVDNSSTRALKELLAVAPITVNMSDYANFEKVGELGTTLPRNDEQITTEAGDLILYLGSKFVIYYDTNSWNFTRLGKINNITQAELMSILGSGDVVVELSLTL